MNDFWNYGGGTRTTTGGTIASLPSGLRGGNAFSTIESYLELVEVPGSTESLAFAVTGDSKSDGDLLWGWPYNSWPMHLQRHVQRCVKPAFGGWKEYQRLATVREALLPYASTGYALNPRVGTAGTVGAFESAAGVVATMFSSAEDALAVYLPDGISHASVRLEGIGVAGTFRADLFAGDVRAAIPPSSSTGYLNTYTTGTTFVSSWQQNDWGQNVQQTDESGATFNTYRGVLVPLWSGLDTSLQPGGSTIVLRKGNVGSAFQSLLYGTGNARNGAWVASDAIWGANSQPIRNAAASAGGYWPPAGGTVGGVERFARIYRWLRRYQHSGWSATTQAATRVVWLHALYTNDIGSLTTTGQIDAYVAEWAPIVAECDALGIPFVWVFVGATAQDQTLTDRLKTKVKELTEAGQLSGWIDTQVVTGLTRTALRARYGAMSPRSDALHEGEILNGDTGRAAARALLGDRMILTP